jgi:hypothetical protein
MVFGMHPEQQKAAGWPSPHDLIQKLPEESRLHCQALAHLLACYVHSKEPCVGGLSEGRKAYWHPTHFGADPSAVNVLLAQFGHLFGLMPTAFAMDRQKIGYAGSLLN